MKMTTKCQHALTTMAYLALREASADPVPGPAIAASIGVSKLYLEQVLALLRRGGLVASVKGAQGGYRLSRPAAQITAADILTAAEPDLFAASETQESQDPLLSSVIDRQVYQKLDAAVRDQLSSVTLLNLVESYHERAGDAGFMFYI